MSTRAAPPTPAPTQPPAPPARRRRRRWRGLLAVVLVLVLVPAWSLGHALTAPGTDSVAARAAEWARAHRLGFLVTGLESAQYRLHPPKVGGTPDAALLRPPVPAQVPATSERAGGGRSSKAARRPVPVVALHAALAPFAGQALPGEGVFRPVVEVAGQPFVQVAYVRPDAQHTSYLAGILWMDGRDLRFVQHPGYADPGHLALWSQRDTIPLGERAGLVATFNGGFKMKDARGGYYADGHVLRTLRDGAASLVIDRSGRATVGMWGRDARLGPDVVSVRQNLQLLVDGGRVVPNVDANVESTWGATLKGAYYVWRSGMGVTAHGDLVYVAGPALSVRTLAQILQRAGAVRAMQLDINTAWVSGMWYSGTGTALTPHKLVDFQRPATRYFTDTSRDFVAVYAR